MKNAAESTRIAAGLKVSDVRDSGALALAEVMALFSAFLLFIKYLETTWFGTVQLYLVGWDYFAHLMMLAFPLALTALMRRPLSDLGLGRAQLCDPEARRISRVAAAELTAIWILFSLVPHLYEGKRLALLLPPFHFGERLGLTRHDTNLIGWLDTVVFTVVFCGVGEEVLFRGYIQGRLNRALGRPFKIAGVGFGWGLIIASLIFGLGHGFAYYNPFVDRLRDFCPNIGEALVTGLEGFILGLIYERTGGIMAPAVIHGVIGLFFSAMIF
ncbi:MAG TPA: CPBP family intramembrane glutamic endopeptidase [bacterium]|nr:CPBP family intramembrane glutamic endopeptidase [bacterium]